MNYNRLRLAGFLLVAEKTLQATVKDEWRRRFNESWDDNDSRQINYLINEEQRAFHTNYPSHRMHKKTFEKYLDELRSRGSDTSTWDITLCAKVCNAPCLDLKTNNKQRADCVKEIKDIRNTEVHSPLIQSITDSKISNTHHKLLHFIGNMKLLVKDELVEELNQNLNQPDPEEIRRENETLRRENDTLRRENATLHICKWLVGIGAVVGVGICVYKSTQVKKAVSFALLVIPSGISILK